MCWQKLEGQVDKSSRFGLVATTVCPHLTPFRGRKRKFRVHPHVFPWGGTSVPSLHQTIATNAKVLMLTNIWSHSKLTL